MAKCETCKKGNAGWEGCAYVVCPKRKPVTVNSPSYYDGRQIATNDKPLSGSTSRKSPTNKE